MEKKETGAVFPTKLLEYRIKRGWSQTTLAAKIGMDEESVRRWEKGKGRPSLYAQQKLCTVFDTTPDELGLSENPRLKRVSSTAIADAAPMVIENNHSSSPSQEHSTQRQEGTQNPTHPPFSPALRRSKTWVIVLTSCLVGVLCLFALWKGFVFQGFPPAHQHSATPTTAPLSHVYYSFEGSIDKWFYEGHILSLQSSNEYAKHGQHALKVRFSSRHAGDDPFVEVAPLPQEPLSSGQTVSMYVYVPTTSPTVSVRPFVMDGSWHWLTPAQAITIPSHTWTKVSYTIPTSVAEAMRVGLQFESTPFNVTSTIYIDAVGWS